MNAIQLKAYAKVNIGLDICGTREDGYHLLKTVMQTVDLSDDVKVKKTDTDNIQLSTDKYFLPNDERNLAYKAAMFVKEKYPQVKGVRIDIKKNIPVGGGMAGGSTDGACVIEALDQLYELQMTQEEKDAIALRLGADVPFCLRKGAYLAEGIGEKLTKLKDLPDLSLVIIAPRFSVSTVWAYKTFDTASDPLHPEMDKLLAAIEEGDAVSIFEHMGNSFEPVVEAEHPEIAEIKKLLEKNGANKALMSGSGSTVFGLFTDRGKAESACKQIKKENPGMKVLVTGFIKGEKNG